MKIPLSWLREFVRLELDTAALCERLTMGGFEVESVEERGADIADVVVGEIVSTARHPNAERLTLCAVRAGGEATVDVVCGATNMRAGDRVAYAPPGTVLPGGRRIERAEIRGVASAGMLCSEAELGLSEAADGILILSADAPLGARLAVHLGIEDTVLDLSVSPNRGDCLSIVGVAREIAALTGERLQRPRVTLRERGAPAAAAIAVRIDAPEGCARYAARLVRGLRVGPSPRWLQQRLLAVGLRPINNVVDVTNYVMIERGQPLHAFDDARLPGREIVVRRAGATARLLTLDGVERVLAPDDLLITTGTEPIAIAGVMGGAGTSVSAATTAVVLESAWFDPASVRRTRRRLELPSEAAFRFERGVDVGAVIAALDRAAALLKQLAGGEVATGVVEAYPGAREPAVLSLRPKRVAELLGVPLKDGEITAALKALGAHVSAGAGASLAVAPPSFRSDLSREIDLIEEVARVVGYQRFPPTLPVAQVSAGVVPERVRWSREVKRVLAATGLTEVVALSFASARANQLFPGVGTTGESVVLRNPLTRDEPEMRRSLLGGLLGLWALNRNQGARGFAAFSLAKVFWRTGAPQEGWRLAGILAGELPQRGLGAARTADFADMKGVVEAIFDHLHIGDRIAWERGGGPLHPGKGAQLRLDGAPIGICGALHPDVEAELGLDGTHWLFELDSEMLLPYSPPRCVFQGLPRFPAVVRDVALVVDEDFPSDRVVQFVRQWRQEMIENISLFDEYIGAPIPAGKKSLAYSISYRAAERTLTDDEVNALHDALTAALRAALPVESR